MRRKKEKGYWIKKTEHFSNGYEAKSRAATLRDYQYITHVKCNKKQDNYIVSYSIAKFYLKELEKAGVKL